MSPKPVGAKLEPTGYVSHIYDIFHEDFMKTTIVLLDYAIVVSESPVKIWHPGTQCQIQAQAVASLLAATGPVEKLREGSTAKPGNKEVSTSGVQRSLGTGSSSAESLAASLERTEGRALGRNRRGLRAFGLLNEALGGNEDVPDGEDDPDRIDMIEPTRARSNDDNHTLGYKIYCVLKWFTDTKSMFSLKVAFLGLALACPAWITNNGTAEFYYKNKGVWALTAALTAKGVFSGETTFGFIQRAIGVVIGGVVALVMWYCSAGSGHGNAYGLAAAFAVVLFFAVPYRVWSTNFLLWITVTTTGALVVGYSWADETAPVAFAPGVGYEIFYKRTLLVLIGITGAWIIDLFPRPKAGREELRKTYAATVLELGSIAAGLVADFRQAPPPTRPSTQFGATHMTKQTSANTAATAAVPLLAQSTSQTAPEIALIGVFNKLRLSTARIVLARLEPSLRRKWSEEQYLKLQEAQYEIVDLLGILGFAFEDVKSVLNIEEMARVLKRLESGVMRADKITALLNAFAITSMSLRSQLPLPSQLPSTQQQLEAADSPNSPRTASEESTVAETQEQQTKSPRAIDIIEGTFVELGREVEKLAAQCQKLFGTNLSYRA
jgi:hypothetical protein